MNMAKLMARADLAVGAGGVTSWERCTLGLPTILVVIAENQRYIARVLAETGAVLLADGDDGRLAEDLLQHVEFLRGDRAAYMRMVENSAAVCDGKGAVRVAEIMLGEIAEHAGCT